ncbi:MAG: hypothetical protein LBV67_09530 [Streptococcaceae bacterium]|jgi:hypothetical protein|nr:hypothetical protein [Streptococcaceae bacterium]
MLNLTKETLLDSTIITMSSSQDKYERPLQIEKRQQVANDEQGNLIAKETNLKVYSMSGKKYAYLSFTVDNAVKPETALVLSSKDVADYLATLYPELVHGTEIACGERILIVSGIQDHLIDYLNDGHIELFKAFMETYHDSNVA